MNTEFGKLENIGTISSFEELFEIIDNLFKEKKFKEMDDLITMILHEKPEFLDTQGYAEIYKKHTETCFYLGEYNNALESAKQELDIRLQLNSPADVATAYNNIAVLNQVIGNIDESAKHFILAIKTMPEEKTEKLEQFAFSFANLNQHYTADFEKAKQYYEKAMSYAQVRNDESKFPMYFTHIAVSLKTMEKYEEAEKKFFRAREVADNKEDIGSIYLRAELLETYIKWSNWIGAERVYKELIELYDSYKNQDEMVSAIYLYTAEMLMNEKLDHLTTQFNNLSGVKTAEKYIIKAIELSANVFSKRVIIMAHLLASKYYFEIDKKTSEEHLQKAEDYASKQNREPWLKEIRVLKEKY